MAGDHNRLIFEKSPYLLQHARNPVDWYPWGREAFERAQKEDKPVFLSIGYSTCHWCHVMAHESFEDMEVAREMNETFVSIKVDREERPDIDHIYMGVCQIMTGSGGWPLTIIMTPNKKPFFAATYIPKETRFGRIGMLELIPRIREFWANNRGQATKLADEVTAALQKSSANTPGRELDRSVLELAYRELTQGFDEQHGGFGSQPKFPTPQNILFLFRYWKRTGDEKALEMARKTLKAMRYGGIYDHIGFGFHRYSTDPHWLVPHFEKMLYDQAMLAMAYTEAHQVTQESEFKETAREIFTYVLRDMKTPDGGFFSAEDADSEGEEGKFYLWTQKEIREVLETEEAELIIDIFNIRKDGNFVDEATGRKTGTNILHLRRPLAESANIRQLSEAELRKRLRKVQQKLFVVRNKRVHPHKDDKVLTDWNGLMIAALAKGAQAFDKPEYANAARNAADFILQNMRKADGRLWHRYCSGQAGVDANLDDYAFFIWGLIELYEAAFDVRYLEEALTLNSDMIRHFGDGEHGGFYFTPDDGEPVLTRKKEIYDGAIPSGNSVAMLNLLRLGRMTGNSKLEETAVGIGRAFSNRVQRMPSAHLYLMVALDFGIGPSYEVTIAGNPQAKDTKALLKAVRTHFIPNKIVLHHPAESEAAEITHLAAFTEHQTSISGKATAYVCHKYSCRLPTTDADEMLRQLDIKKPTGSSQRPLS